MTSVRYWTRANGSSCHMKGIFKEGEGCADAGLAEGLKDRISIQLEPDHRCLLIHQPSLILSNVSSPSLRDTKGLKELHISMVGPNSIKEMLKNISSHFIIFDNFAHIQCILVISTHYYPLSFLSRSF